MTSAASNSYRRKAYRCLKRAFDIGFSLCAILLLFPLGILISLAIILTSGWPPMYRHERVGYRGKRLRVLKFRTMCRNAEEMRKHFTQQQRQEWQQHCKLSNDPRITTIGHILRKTGLDELPQLLHVLRGDMSLVGPRPITQEETERYGAQRALLLSVPPGITGNWQVSAKKEDTYEARMAMELAYAANPSLRWDAYILLKTVGVVLMGKNRE